MDPIVDPRCLVSTESVIIDGANGVCHEARLHAHDGPGMPALFALVMMLGALSWLVRERISLALRRGLLITALAGASIPGLTALLAVRADAPGSIARSARRIERTHDETRAFAEAHGCAWIRTDTSLAAVPITRLAIVDRRCADPAPIDLFADALETGCTQRTDGSLACGTVDDDSRLPVQAEPPPLPLPRTP